jgi:hypothetical protein
MTRRRQWLCLLCLLLGGTAAAGDALVLVGSARGDLATPDTLTIRKAFLGLNTTLAGRPVRALMNQSDPALRQAFLQNVMGFSEQAFQRRVLTLKLQQGRPEPRAFDDESALARALQADGNGISYMWQSHAERTLGLRVLKVLWQP